ncbi:hypothetical protein ALC57_09272, partial [Trachymyrmex cornetzi]
EDWTVSSDDTEAGAQRGVIRYVVTRCLHVRRCCTGEMFQPTRLKGQLTPSCLAPLASKLPAPSTPYRPYVPPLFCPRSLSHPYTVFPPPRPPVSAFRQLLSLRSFFLSASFCRRFVVYSIGHVRITARGNVDVTAVTKNEKNLSVHNGYILANPRDAG